MRSKCRCSHVLQFTFRRAVSCVLHRPPSQVIHCRVLFSQKLQHRSARLGKHSTMVWFTSHHGVSTSNPSSRRRYLCSSTYPLAQVIGALHLKLRPLESKGSHWGSDIAVHSVAEPCRRAQIQRRIQPASQPYASQGLAVNLTSQRSKQPLMILPQVHLRKPCYDFYFL